MAAFMFYAVGVSVVFAIAAGIASVLDLFIW